MKQIWYYLFLDWLRTIFFDSYKYKFLLLSMVPTFSSIWEKKVTQASVFFSWKTKTNRESISKFILHNDCSQMKIVLVCGVCRVYANFMVAKFHHHFQWKVSRDDWWNILILYIWIILLTIENNNNYWMNKYT